MKTLVFYIVLVCFISTPSLIFSQNDDYPTYPIGFALGLDSVKIDSLKKMMSDEDPDWAAVQKCFFDSVYDSKLPDLICYVKEDTAIIALVQGGDEKKELFGERFIWVLLFSDYDLNDVDNLKCKKKRGKKDSATVDLNVLAYEKEPGERTILGVLGAISELIFGSNVKTDSKAEGFEDRTLNIELMKHCDKGETIYTWMGKFKIGLNTKNRIVIRPPFNLEKKDFLFINYNFGNFEQSLFGVSLGFGVSTGHVSTDSDSLSDANRVNIFAYGHIYICRPKLPVNKESFSFTLGTNFIKEDFLKNIILGIRYGPSCLYPVGIIVGVNWRSVTNDSRKIHPFFGLDYKL